MPGPPVAAASLPARLLDDYLARARAQQRSLLETALRTRSPAARQLLARLAVGAPPDALLAAARARRHGGVPPLEPDPQALVDLARVIALQDLFPTDQADGLALLDLALDRFGPERIPDFHQGLHAQLAYHLGDPARSAALTACYSQISPAVRSALLADLANPLLSSPGADPAEWLNAFRAFFPAPGPSLADRVDRVPFDRITAVVDRATNADQTISVIITSFMPDTGLVTSVRSLLDQSWPHVEVLVVDDASPPDYDPVLDCCAAMDDRVRLVRLPTNGGTYLARNAGLDAASGRIVTFQDADDWSHPLRLEHQARPLLDDTALVATLSNGLRATENLRVTRLGRVLVQPIESSLMFRKDQVLSRIGYFDSVRKAADSEYRMRVEAAFGREAVRRLDGPCYSLVRIKSNSLSYAEIRSGWMHPARAAYRSAFGLWHCQIRDGTASSYLPRDLKQRPFAAPAHVRGASQPAPLRGYDVVFAGDWRRNPGPQQSTLEEIKALTRHRMRVGVLHLESYRFLTQQRQPLCQPVQRLINDGTVDHLLGTEPAEVSLLIVEDPSVLQFPPGIPCHVRADRVVIHAGEAPCRQDGTDQRYDPQTCTRATQELFSAEPTWLPRGPAVRAVLGPRLPSSAALAPFDRPGTVDPARWRLHRPGFRSSVPVIGRHSPDDRMEWPAEPETLRQVYAAPDFDVRILGGAGVPRRLLGTGRTPVNWLVYDYHDVTSRSFLYQLDFYVYFSHPDAVEVPSRAILEALAAGCVTILPETLSEMFGDAAIYCRAAEVRQVIRAWHADRHGFLRQSRRATDRVRERYGHDSYARLVRSLLGRPAGGETRDRRPDGDAACQPLLSSSTT